MDGADVGPTYGSPVGIVLGPYIGFIDTGANNDGEAKDGTFLVGLKTSGGDFATGDNFVAAGFEVDDGGGRVFIAGSEIGAMLVGIVTGTLFDGDVLSIGDVVIDGDINGDLDRDNGNDIGMVFSIVEGLRSFVGAIGAKVVGSR